MDVPFLDLRAQHLPHASEIEAAIQRVLYRGWYLMGEELSGFETEFAAWTGVEHVLGCASGTDAITLALRGLGVSPGDEVVTVANTCVPTVAAIRNAGGTPVLVDVDAKTLTMDPAALAGALTPKTYAIVPVHLYGHPCDMDSILEFARVHELHVVEDCAQAHGARYRGRRCGTMGHAAAFSFYPSKNLGAYGDAGAVVTDNENIASRARKIRVYGESERYYHDLEGINSRMDEIQAAILRVKLTWLDESVDERRAIAKKYDELLSESAVTPVGEAEWGESAYHLYVIRTERREKLQAFLRERGVGTLIHYPVPIHLQEAYRFLPYEQGSFPVAEAAAKEVLSLPLYPGLTEDAQEYVVASIREFFGG